VVCKIISPKTGKPMSLPIGVTISKVLGDFSGKVNKLAIAAREFGDFPGTI
jgi:hypothetical protein